jgi:hypothetical protein
MIAGVAVVTTVVVTENVAVVCPAATVTLAGTAATAALLLPSVTTAPPAGAALLSVTVPCELTPPATLLGFNPSVTPKADVPAATCAQVILALGKPLGDPPAKIANCGFFSASTVELTWTHVTLSTE